MAWNGSGAPRGEADGGRIGGGRRRKPAAVVRLSALAAVVGIGCCLFFGRRMAPAPEERDGAPVRRKRAAARPAAHRAAATNAIAVAVSNCEEMVTLPDGRRVRKPGTIAEAVSLVQLAPGYHRYKNVDEVFARTNEFQVGGYRPPLFRHEVESKLSLIATRPRDMTLPPMPPLPPNAERDFMASLAEPIEVLDGEDPGDAEIKRRVGAMKLGMKDLIEREGMTVRQAFHEMEARHNRLANMTRLFKGEYVRMVAKGEEGASEFLEAANRVLREHGACEFDENARTIDP